MTPAVLTAIFAGALAGFVAASLAIARALKQPPEQLIRTNVNGREVPAVLGAPVTLGGLLALIVMTVAGLPDGWAPPVGRAAPALALVLVVMGLAGAWDDRRGDETSRGFKGHLAALARGRVTGGALKILAGAVAGVGAGIIVFPFEPSRAAATALLVAAGANTINLFDRAPGRAGKVTLLVLLPLLAFGHVGWAVAAAGVAGALVASLPVDLAAKAMLGDAGANPLGAVIGLGLALSLGGWAAWAAVAVLVAVNLASERWSFSQLIQSSPFLDSLDRAGRK